MLWPRWLFLRALGLIFFSAFYALAFQMHGLIGEWGILPAGLSLDRISTAFGPLARVWFAPTLLWINSNDSALTLIAAAGLIASVLLVLNVWPKLTVALCTVLFLSCIATLQDFSSYQSDGMLLEAGFLSIFFAPRGVRPGLGATDPPSRFSLFMLRWEWFRIYFESGLVKLLSGDHHWRNFTAMDDYYQNAPLPSWMGWYVQQLPHWYHAGTVVIILVVELVLVWAVFLPRRFRVACFLFVTALQIGIIATANYGFLNYVVLALGVLLLDDRALTQVGFPCVSSVPPANTSRSRICRRAETAVLGLAFYTTIVAFLFGSSDSILALPSRLLQPFRIANAYGLFAIMTPARYEIEFQGSNDGKTWVAYPFRYKPQDPMERPGFDGPYQPRLDWNLWFASLAPWGSSPWVVLTEERLLEGSPSVLALFRADPFHGKQPSMVRTVLWQYSFTDLETKRRTGAWWRRQELGPFSPGVTRAMDGSTVLTAP
ncbi:MAG TPA: lipase maturation factor family protein [Gemmatimonadaceae bacterium]|nr:lipase maturation factor family protein [Gemmatimonadaceae bacterium]